MPLGKQIKQCTNKALSMKNAETQWLVTKLLDHVVIWSSMCQITSFASCSTKTSVCLFNYM